MHVTEDQQAAAPPGRPLASVASASGVWEFDGYRLDEPARTLYTPTGDARSLDRSAFLVLQYLLLHAGQLCSQDELLAAGWPRRRVEVNSLAKCISRLRRLLADEAADCIRLIHGYGYQLSVRAHYVLGPALADDGPPVLDAGALVPGRPEWRLQRQIGTGACGPVHAASHVGSLPPRAYKFALEERGLRGLKREVALQRYLRLEHPALDCVLPLLDAELERPPYFLATPLQVQGSFAEWAKADAPLRQLPRAERLALALALCDAVAALHATGLAHRDLKPQNLYLQKEQSCWRVLFADLGAGAGMLPPGVDGNGVPIGSLTRDGVEEASSGPERYLAPELLAGAAATQRSDLYALGLLVFQIMVADLHAALAPGWEALLADSLLAADVALAANVDPLARPATAAVLAERLRTLENRRAALRELEQAEAMARELARLREGAQRRRQQLTVVVVMAALAVGALLMTLQLYRGALDAQAQASASQQQAELDARTAKAVLSFMNTTLLDQADPWATGESDPAMKALLERAAAQIDQRFHDQPASAAAVHEAVADAWEGWGQYDKAIRHSRQALDLLATQAVAPLIRARLLLKLCRQARMAQTLDRAEAACGAGVQIEEAQLGRVSPALNVELAKLRYEQGRCAETLQLTDDLLAALPSQPDPTDIHWLRDALWFRGICHGQTAEFAAGRREFQQLLALPWDLKRPADLFNRAWVEMDYAELLVMEGDFNAAQPLLESAAAVFSAKLGKEHPDAALADYQRARIRFWAGDPRSAAEIYQRVLDNWSQRLGRDHLWTLYTHSELLWARTAAGLPAQQHAAAVAELQDLRARVLPQLQSRLPQRSFFAEIWAWTALALGEFEIAAEELARSRADSQAVLPLSHPRHALLDCIEADLLRDQQQPQEARRLLDRCAAGLAGLPPDNYRRRWLLALQEQHSP